MYRKKNGFHQDIARTILSGKRQGSVTEEELAHFAEMPKVQTEIASFSENFLAICDDWNEEKDTVTREPAEPVEKTTNEVGESDKGESGKDGDPVSNSHVAGKSPDSSLPEKVFDDQATLPEEKSDVEGCGASGREQDASEAIPVPDGSHPANRESDGGEVGPPNLPIEHQNQKPPPTNDKPPTVNLAKEPAKPMARPQARFRLANATVGRDYADELGIECPVDILVTNITGLSEVGLEYDSEEAIVKGCPAKSGEFKLSAQYRLTADPDGGTWSQDFTFIVNPDPRSLWKDIASDRSVPFWKADNENQGKVGQGHWMLAAASRRGRSHAHVGGCRDDDFHLISSNTSGWHVLAVSDGAGSAEFSREGSRLAVQCASAVLADRLGELGAKLEKAILAWQQGRVDEENEYEKTLKDCLYNVFRAAVYEPVKEIHELARKKELQYRDFYATLLLCAHKTIGNEQFVAGYWIGDGALAVYAESEYVKLLGESDGGEYAGQTRFLDPDAVSGEEIMRRIRFDSHPDLSAVFLMTDGVSDPKFETDANLQKREKWDDFWKEIKPELDKDPKQTSKNLLDWLGFWSPGNHDDRTLAMLYPGSVVTGITSADTAEDAPKEEIPDTEGTGDE